MKVIPKIPLALFLLETTTLGLWAQNNPPVQCQCCDPPWCAVVQGPTGTITSDSVVFTTGSGLCVGGDCSTICMGDCLYASPRGTTNCSTVIYQVGKTGQTPDCPPDTITAPNWCPFVVTNWWVVSSPGFSGSREGAWVCIAPTNCGSGTVTLYATYRNVDPCTGQRIGGGTISVSKNFTVVNVQVTPTSTNSLINRCQDPNRSVTFCLTNSCDPNGVSWSISPVVADGATLTSNGDCATIKIGKVVQDYTITAISNDDTNCLAVASLSVARDCVCTNHILNPNPILPPTEGHSQCGDSIRPWSGSVTNYPCGQTAQIVCAPCNQANNACNPSATCFILYVNGQDVGHCLYDRSQISAGYYQCNCGAMIVGSTWRIVNTATGNGYYLNTHCDVREGPHCFDSSNNPRACNSGCDDY